MIINREVPVKAPEQIVYFFIKGDNDLTFMAEEPSAAAFAELQPIDEGIPAAAWAGLAVFGALGAAVLWLVFGRGSGDSLNNEDKD